MPKKDNGRSLFLSDLKKSGIDPRDSTRKYGITHIEPLDCEAYTSKKVPGTIFKYYDIDDNEIPDFCRIKYLSKPDKGAFSNKSPGKYWQPTGSISHLYFPRGPDWRAIAEDANQEIYITEGEKKALCGVLHGLNMLAVAGVSNWKSSKNFNQPVIADMDLINWKGRSVVLCFDADMVTNPQVTKQLNDLSRELTERGARKIRIVKIPATTILGTKCGLDDYIVEFGFDAYKKLIATSEEVKNTAELWKLNERFAYIETLNRVYDFLHEKYLTKDHFFAVTAGIKVTKVTLRGKEGSQSVSTTEDAANELWWEWKSRRNYDSVVYKPGEPRMIGNNYNLWGGFAVEPEVGDIEPFLDFFNRLTCKLTPSQRLWFLQWLAWPLKYPERGKMFSAVMMHSRTQGTGKTLLGKIMMAVYGEKNSILLTSPNDLLGDYNGHLENIQFAFADEVLVGSRQENNRIKNFITSETLRVSEKYVPSYTIKALMNWYMASNQPDPLKIAERDRRWFICNAIEEKLPQEMADAVIQWMSKKENLAALLYFFQNDVDMKGFNPLAEPPRTDAHAEMIESTYSQAEQWARELKNDPDSVLRVDGVRINCDLFTETDWASVGIVPNHIRSNTVTLRHIFRDLDFPMRRRLKSSKHWPGGEKTLWCLRNQHFWEHQSRDDWANHYAKWLKETRRYQGKSKISGKKG